MTTYCITCKKKECGNHGKSVVFDWECKSYINNVYTNADNIREMSDEELANFFSAWTNTGACNDFGITHKRKCDSNCLECIKEWLQMPSDIA